MTAAGQLEHFSQENLSWERLLEFFRQENSFLKTRLSEVVDNSTDREFLAFAEQFQNQFILKDEFIDELLHDVHTQERNLKQYFTTGKTSVDKKDLKMQEKLRNEMEYLEKDYFRLRSEFFRYLTSLYN